MMLKLLLKIQGLLKKFVSKQPYLQVYKVPLSEQQYTTLGDYCKTKYGVRFKITDIGNQDFENLIFLHEYNEYLLTQKRGITIKQITDFDLQWEVLYYKHLNTTQEPGDDPKAPYHKEHEFAKLIEREICEQLGYSWEEYDNYVMSKC